MEVWKTVKEFPRYEVSNAGRIRSKPGWRAFGNRRRWVDSTVLKPHLQGTGYYPFVHLWDGEKAVSRFIHRLVATAFVGPSKGKQVNHLDGHKDNNSSSNLQWVTGKQNCLHRSKVLGIGIGESNGRAKLSAVQVGRIRADKRLQRVIARDYGITNGTVSKIRTRKLWNY